MRIGMAGVQSRHLDFFSEQINLEKRFPGVTVTGVWGDDEPQRLPEIAQSLQIPNIYNDFQDILDNCDTVFVLMRDGYRHMQYAKAALQQGKHVFVDKPFAVTGEDGAELIRLAEEKGLALCGGSTLPYLPQIPELVRKAALTPLTMISYCADPDSIYGGWAYYGSHLCDLCAILCGTDAKSVSAKRTGNVITVTVSYENKQAILHSSPAARSPQIIVGEESLLVENLDDSICFRYGLEGFIHELETHSTESYCRLRFSALLLESSIHSFNEGRDIIL